MEAISRSDTAVRQSISLEEPDIQNHLISHPHVADGETEAQREKRVVVGYVWFSQRETEASWREGLTALMGID